MLTYEADAFRCEPPTELELRFDRTPGGTRVTLEHRGLERLTQTAFDNLGAHAWEPLVTWFRTYVERELP